MGKKNRFCLNPKTAQETDVRGGWNLSITAIKGYINAILATAKNLSRNRGAVTPFYFSIPIFLQTAKTLHKKNNFSILNKKNKEYL
jgi:hypothetical protein